MQLSTIQTLTENLASSLKNIESLAIERENKLAAIEREYDVLLRPHCLAFTGRRAALKAAIATAPELFKRPRTYTFDGIKVGYQKQKGKIVIQDEVDTVDKIIKYFGEKKAVQYLHVVTSVDKTACNDMPADTMKKLGIQLTADTDAIIIKPEQSALEKQIAVLVAEDQTAKEAA